MTKPKINNVFRAALYELICVVEQLTPYNLVVKPLRRLVIKPKPIIKTPSADEFDKLIESFKSDTGSRCLYLSPGIEPSCTYISPQTYGEGKPARLSNCNNCGGNSWLMKTTPPIGEDLHCEYCGTRMFADADPKVIIAINSDGGDITFGSKEPKNLRQ